MGILPMSRRAILAPHWCLHMGETPMIHTGKMPVLLLAPSYDSFQVNTTLPELPDRIASKPFWNSR